MDTILLDIGNVLVTVDFMSFCHGVAAPGPSVPTEIFRKYCSGPIKNRYDTGIIGSGAFLAELCSDRLVRPMAETELQERWQRIFSPFPGAEAGVAALEDLGSIWIMSDTDPLHFAYLHHAFPLLRGRERYYLSFRHGFLKSSPSAFRHVLLDSGVNAGRCILIDDREDNCRAAVEAGIRSVLFTSWPQAIAALQRTDGGVA
jgi:FMN phosphatase YigB (HAD superfamily)